MKNIKNLLLVLMTISLLATGCGSSNNTGKKEDKKEIVNKEDKKKKEKEKDSDEIPNRGIWDGSNYSNEYSKLSFTAPEGWKIATDEEIAEAMGMGLDMLEDNQNGWSKEALEKVMDLKVITDTMIVDEVTGENIIIQYENLAKTIGGTEMTAKDYVEVLAKQIPQMYSGYEIGEIAEKEVCGETYVTLKASNVSMGVDQYYYSRRKGNYIINILLTRRLGNDPEAIMSIFK